MKKTFDRDRAMSWSSFSSFSKELSEYADPEKWYRKYVLNEKERDTPELIFGKKFAKSIEDGKPLAPVTLLTKAEHPFKVMYNKIPMVGYVDAFCTNTQKKIGEYKTGAKAWDQKKVDRHGQITFYALFNFITNKVRPEDTEFFLEWIPTKKIPRNNGDFSGFDYDIDFVYPIEVVRFNTQRSMSDVLTMGSLINKVYKEMEDYCENHQ